MDNKLIAQQRADQIRAFNNEVKMLEDEKVLTLEPPQREAVAQYHQSLLKTLSNQFDIDTSDREKQLSSGMKIASFLGALAMAASVFFLFYQFWGYLTTPAQVSVLVLAPLLTLGLTYFIAQYETTGYFAKLLAMVSFVCFILNLSMLGQIFNITPSDKALLVWAAYGFLLAYAFDVRLLLAMGIMCLAAFIAARVGSWSGMYWLYMGERPENFLLPALVIFSLPTWINQKPYSGFAPVYRVAGCLLFLIPVLVLSSWGGASYLDFPDAVIEGFYQLTGFVVSGALVATGIKKHWSDVVNTGNVFFVLFLYTKLFDWWWEIMPRYLFFLVIALCSLLLLFVYKRIRHHSQLTGEHHV
ncbi:MAG: DUF2157 domain-containing protein [Gammaproteobacteria bacterium]|nr:DUF2157 domain-containing protein [Gammaproteobacteria bacterium]